MYLLKGNMVFKTEFLDFGDWKKLEVIIKNTFLDIEKQYLIHGKHKKDEKKQNKTAKNSCMLLTFVIKCIMNYTLPEYAQGNRVLFSGVFRGRKWEKQGVFAVFLLHNSRRPVSVTFLKKFFALMLALALCATGFTSVLATETGEEDGEKKLITEEFGVTFTEVNEIVYATTGVNIRKGPGTQHQVVGYLDWGYGITRIGIGDNGWSMVIHNDEVAYIYSEYLSTERPKDFTTDLDDTGLMRQIAIANGLRRSDYTDKSWEAVMAALTSANWALNGNSQNAADAAEEALRAAISALVRMDYSDLSEALDSTEEFVASAELSGLWMQLAEAVAEGRELMTSGDQEAVDAAADRINGLLEQIRAAMNDGSTPGVIIQEVPVEVPPTDAYCNIPMHRVWPVLFFLSFAVNAALAAVIVIYIRRKKQNRVDDMPLVDYDIMDDTL